MRKRNQKQMPLTPRTVDHPHAIELELISQILNHIPTINEVAWQDLTQHVDNVGTGAEGMSAEQVARFAIVKQMEDYSYDELAPVKERAESGDVMQLRWLFIKKPV